MSARMISRTSRYFYDQTYECRRRWERKSSYAWVVTSRGDEGGEACGVARDGASVIARCG